MMCSCKNSTIVIGISGVTCGGKTTLANAVQKAFPQQTVACVSQDDYFFKEDDARHTWIKELNHINFDILSSLDMKQMEEDVVAILEKRKKIKQTYNKAPSTIAESVVSLKNGFLTDNSQLINIITETLMKHNLQLLILEGFCIFNYPAIVALCDLKFFFTLKKEECKNRRDYRVYDPPDCPGYFEQCAWPEHLIHLEEIQKTVTDIIYFNEECKDVLNQVLLSLYKMLLR